MTFNCMGHYHIHCLRCECHLYPGLWMTPQWGCSRWVADVSSVSEGGWRPEGWRHHLPPYWTIRRALSAPSERGEPGLKTRSHMTAACTYTPHTLTLTQGLQVTVCEAARVKVEALQVCEVSEVVGEAAQSSTQTFVTGQVQLSHWGEALEQTTCRTRRGEQREKSSNRIRSDLPDTV